MMKEGAFDLDLYRDFLKKKNRRPLFSCMWEPMINPSQDIMKRAGDNGTIKASQVEPADILDMAGIVLKTYERLRGDLPYALQASGGHQWMEAICGCAIMASNGQIWATHPENHSLDDFLAAPLCEAWEEKLTECHEKVLDFAKGRCFAAVPVLHGPVDILSAFIGTRELAYAVCDEPDKLAEALHKAGDVFLRIAKELTDKLTPYMGGYCGRMHIYTEKACVTLQDDNSYMTSPPVFRTLLEPVERRIIAGVPAAVYHMHNSSLHLASIVSDYGMDVIQLSVDPNGPPIEAQIAVYEEMKHKTPLVLSCWDFDTLELLRRRLTPEGLALTFVPAPDGCRVDANGTFDDMMMWQEAYESLVKLYGAD